MKNRSLWCFVILSAVVVTTAWGGDPASQIAAQRGERQDSIAAAQVRNPVEQKVLETYGNLPLSFETNRGQTNRRVKFLSRGTGSTLFLTSADAVLVLRHGERATGLRMRLVGGNRRPDVSGLDQLSGRTNYFIGNDAKKWRTNIPTYGKVEYRDVYPGVNLVYYGNQRQLEYDFVVSPGADPKAIRLEFAGIDSLSLDISGDLVLTIASRDVRLRKPIVYQQSDGNREVIPACFVINKDTRQVGFELAEYDATRPLIIDPVLAYSTYLGGSGDDLGQGIAVDGSGNAYVTGSTGSTDFPTTAGGFDRTINSFQNAFVTKINVRGSALAYSTFLGGSAGNNAGYAIAVDGAGNAYVTGLTNSTDFPTTPGAFATVLNSVSGNAFVTKLNATGSALTYSTFLGGSSFEIAFGIAVDRAGNAYVTGVTASTNFPTTPGAFDTTFNGGQDAFVTKINATGSALTYSTFLGGSGFEGGQGIAVDRIGNAYVTGSTNSADFPVSPDGFHTFNGGSLDAFVTKINAGGSALIYSTFLGGSATDWGQGIAVDGAFNAYVTGTTLSTNFPTTAGAFNTTRSGSDAFVTKLTPAGSALAYSTFLGGSSGEIGLGIAVDAGGNAWVTGTTTSTDFPTTPDAFNTTLDVQDAFATKLNAAGSALTYSTFLGGRSAGLGIAVDPAGNAYITGWTFSPDFPTTRRAFDTTYNGSQDGFVTKLAGAVPFDEFNAKVDIEFGRVANSDAFRVQGFFALGGASNGINPVTEVVTLQLGTFSVTIPAGSFVLTNSGSFGFKGAIGAVKLSVEIQSLGSGVFKFKADGEGADLTGTMNPVTIVLTIGNDSGRTTVTAKLKY